jgi:DNA-directed RNA polymerase specialized sigma24 family protein
MMRRHWRASARRAQVFWVLACVSRTSTDDRSSEQLDARRNVQQIRAAFDALSEKVRIAFVLCELEGISAKEASIVLESSETAVWKRVSDARRILLKAVGEPQP